MEKCTYCTQRIASARIEAEKDGRKVRDGEILTACQSVCPADAIVFGDLNDKERKGSKVKADHRNYNFLNELNKSKYWFGAIQALPHPRFIVQYKSKELDAYIDRYLQAFILK